MILLFFSKTAWKRYFIDKLLFFVCQFVSSVITLANLSCPPEFFNRVPISSWSWDLLHFFWRLDSIPTLYNNTVCCLCLREATTWTFDSHVICSCAFETAANLFASRVKQITFTPPWQLKGFKQELKKKLSSFYTINTPNLVTRRPTMRENVERLLQRAKFGWKLLRTSQNRP